MTTSIEDKTDATPDGGGNARPVRAGGADRGRPRRWWLHPPWLALFSVVVIAWLAAFVLPTYVGLDRSRTTVLLRPEVWFHYPVLIVHVVTGAVALLAGCVQMSAQLRRSAPRTHRTVGRVYLFGGVLPGTLSALTLIGINVQAVPTDAGLSISLGNTIWALLWTVTSLEGYRLARAGRFADHRRLMIYSFALTTAILWTRPVAVVAFTTPGFDMRWFYENIGWMPWVLNLAIAQMWLNRTARRPVEVPVGSSGPRR